MPTRKHAPVGRDRHQVTKALRPFLVRQDSPVELRVWPGPVKTAIICVKDSLSRRWDQDGWLRQGVLLVTFRSIQPVAGLRPALAAIAALTKRVVFIGDLDPVDLTMFVMLQAAMPPGVELVYGGIDDEWLAKENASRDGEGSPYFWMPKAELRLWRALKEAHPSIAKIIGPNSKYVLDRGVKLEIEGACELSWHAEAMVKLAFRRALGKRPPPGPWTRRQVRRR